MGNSKSSSNLFYFRQSVLNKILAPDVFNYKDSKSKSWHRAKISRSIYGQPTLFSVTNNHVNFNQLYSKIIKQFFLN